MFRFLFVILPAIFSFSDSFSYDRDLFIFPVSKNGGQISTILEAITDQVYAPINILVDGMESSQKKLTEYAQHCLGPLRLRRVFHMTSGIYNSRYYSFMFVEYSTHQEEEQYVERRFRIFSLRSIINVIATSIKPCDRFTSLYGRLYLLSEVQDEKGNLITAGFLSDIFNAIGIIHTAHRKALTLQVEGRN